MAEPQIIIDHLVGSLRGRRQVFASGAVIRFGRHPDCEVCFDAHRDLDASSRHAEIERDGDALLLRDVGSSNGTFVAGQRVAEVPLHQGQPVMVEFGAGGPRVRIFVGELDQAPAVPETAAEPRPGVMWLMLLGAAIGAAVFVIWAVWGR